MLMKRKLFVLYRCLPVFTLVLLQVIYVSDLLNDHACRILWILARPLICPSQISITFFSLKTKILSINRVYIIQDIIVCITIYDPFIYCVVIKDVSQFLYFLVYAYHRTDGSLAHISSAQYIVGSLCPPSTYTYIGGKYK